MNRLGLLLLLAALVSSSIAPVAWGATETVDAVHSSVLFRIKHMNTSYAWGRFNDIQGTIDLDGPQPQVDVTVKVDSVDTANAKRDEHLKGPDFFGAKQFPTITFHSESIKKLDDNRYQVDGTLTLHGISKPLSVTLERTGSARTPMTGKIAGYATEFQIKRSDFGMKLMIGPLGDDVRILVSLECVEK
jgi:polyisoprenoid-binding protein YceI